jgi:hypothetical protein
VSAGSRLSWTTSYRATAWPMIRPPVIVAAPSTRLRSTIPDLGSPVSQDAKPPPQSEREEHGCEGELAPLTHRERPYGDEWNRSAEAEEQAGVQRCVEIRARGWDAFEIELCVGVSCQRIAGGERLGHLPRQTGLQALCLVRCDELCELAGRDRPRCSLVPLRSGDCSSPNRSVPRRNSSQPLRTRL